MGSVLSVLVTKRGHAETTQKLHLEHLGTTPDQPPSSTPMYANMADMERWGHVGVAHENTGHTVKPTQRKHRPTPAVLLDLCHSPIHSPVTQ